MTNDILLDLMFLWAILAGGALVYGLMRTFQIPHEFMTLFTELEGSHNQNQKTNSHFLLPLSVHRYFKEAHISQGKRPTYVHARYTGFHRLSPHSDLLPIHGDIYYCLSMPGFFSKSRTKMHRFIWTDIIHRYSINDSYLIGKLFSIIPFLSARGIRLSKSCLITYFSEAVWFPWVFTSSKNISWEPIDDKTARLRVSYHPLIVALDVQFNSKGLIQSVSYPSKPQNNGHFARTCTKIVSYNEYKMIDGLFIPHKIEVKQKSAHQEQVEKVLMLETITYHADPPSRLL